MVSFENKNKELISKVSQYPVLLNFWENISLVDNLSLPQNYPLVTNILAFQDAYTYNSVNKESLIGKNEGDFKENWLVIATNYFADPFFIDLQQVSDNFPVYFAWHGAGEWKPITIAPSLVEFQNILHTISATQVCKNKLLSYVQTLNTQGNEFWEELYETILHQTSQTKDTFDVDQQNWQEVEIYITDIGPNKIKIVSLLKQQHQISAAQALELSKGARIFYGKGIYKFVTKTILGLENAGATLEVVAL